MKILIIAIYNMLKTVKLHSFFENLIERQKMNRFFINFVLHKLKDNIKYFIIITED